MMLNIMGTDVRYAQVYYDLFDQSLFGKPNSENIPRGKFFLLTNTRCTKLHTSTGSATKDVNIGVA